MSAGMLALFTMQMMATITITNYGNLKGVLMIFITLFCKQIFASN